MIRCTFPLCKSTSFWSHAPSIGANVNQTPTQFAQRCTKGRGAFCNRCLTARQTHVARTPSRRNPRTKGCICRLSLFRKSTYFVHKAQPRSEHVAPDVYHAPDTSHARLSTRDTRIARTLRGAFACTSTQIPRVVLSWSTAKAHWARGRTQDTQARRLPNKNAMATCSPRRRPVFSKSSEPGVL